MLCDGNCSRAYHLKCLVPPLEPSDSEAPVPPAPPPHRHLGCPALAPALRLRSPGVPRPHAVPEGDEGWLCPSCDAKVDALCMINDVFGAPHP